jgi:hypothetical protein
MRWPPFLQGAIEEVLWLSRDCWYQCSSVLSQLHSRACTFPRENGSRDKTAGAAGQQTSRGEVWFQPRTPPEPLMFGLQLKVKWESGKLSLDAEAVQLSEVLLGISRATGIEVTGAKGLSNLVSCT